MIVCYINVHLLLLLLLLIDDDDDDVLAYAFVLWTWLMKISVHQTTMETTKQN